MDATKIEELKKKYNLKKMPKKLKVDFSDCERERDIYKIIDEAIKKMMEERLKRRLAKKAKKEAQKEEPKKEENNNTECEKCKENRQMTALFTLQITDYEDDYKPRHGEPLISARTPKIFTTREAAEKEAAEVLIYELNERINGYEYEDIIEKLKEAKHEDYKIYFYEKEDEENGEWINKKYKHDLEVADKLVDIFMRGEYCDKMIEYEIEETDINS